MAFQVTVDKYVSLSPRWQNWPSDERDEDSDMDIVFFEKWRDRDDGLSFRNAPAPVMLDGTISGFLTTGSGWIELWSGDIWIPSFAKYVVARFQSAISEVVDWPTIDYRVTIGSSAGTG